MEEDVKVTAVADLRPEYAKAAAEKFSAQIYQEGMDLIGQADVDVIDICLPTYLHTKYAVAAMKKGRAVFIEKPVCLSPDEMELLLAAQRETGVPVMVGQCIRLWSEYAWLKEAVENKTYGALRSGVFKMCIRDRSKLARPPDAPAYRMRERGAGRACPDRRRPLDHGPVPV